MAKEEQGVTDVLDFFESVPFAGLHSEQQLQLHVNSCSTIDLSTAKCEWEFQCEQTCFVC